MDEMLRYCSSLKTINFGHNFDTRNVIDTRDMFDGCSSLENLDLSNFNTTALKYAIGMFMNCDNISLLRI